METQTDTHGSQETSGSVPARIARKRAVTVHVESANVFDASLHQAVVVTYNITMEAAASVYHYEPTPDQ